MSPTSKSPGKTKVSGQDPWEDRHTRILTQAVIELVKTHRKELYKVKGLAGEVDGHGGDRIRQKLDIMLRKLGPEVGAGPKGKSPSRKRQAVSESALEVEMEQG